MKKFLPYLAIIIMVATVTGFNSCSKDDSSEGESLVLIKRSTGKLYTVNETNGDLTEIGAITYEGEPLTNLRCLVYDPASKKVFAGATTSGNGYLYSVNMKTGVATLLNDNSDENWDGISGLLASSGDSLISIIYSNMDGTSGSCILRFNKANGNEGIHRRLGTPNDGFWSAGGIMYGANSSQLITGGDSEIFISDLNGLISNTIPLVLTETINDDDTYVQALAKNENSVFGIVYEYNDKNQYLVKLNTSTGELTELKLLSSGGNANFYLCLAFIPKSELP